MHFRNGLLAAAFVGYIIAVAHVSAQGTTQTPPGGAPQRGQPAPGGRGQGRGGEGRGAATFPAQQRPPGDPVLIERGKALYTINCSACHGPDLRGGATGGPNLLRSAVVLNDQSGELILPIVRGARAERGMPPLPLGDDDVKAVAEFIHSIVATARNQGAPPATEAPPPNALVGNAAAGETYFNAKCSSCHQASGDLQGISSRFPEAKALQNAWVAGGGGRGGGRAATPSRRTVTVTVTQPSGEKAQGRLVRIDNFIVTLEESDGSIRSFRRDGERPKVEINDPMAGHRTLLLALTDKDMHDVTAYLATLK
jgi:cytochrome c oxidase cbb3-type subunit 3